MINNLLLIVATAPTCLNAIDKPDKNIDKHIKRKPPIGLPLHKKNHTKRDKGEGVTDRSRLALRC